MHCGRFDYNLNCLAPFKKLSVTETAVRTDNRTECCYEKCMPRLSFCLDSRPLVRVWVTETTSVQPVSRATRASTASGKLDAYLLLSSVCVCGFLWL